MVKPIGEPREFSNPDDPNAQITEYIRLVASIDHMDERRKELREKIFSYLEDEGFEDEKGNLQLPLANPIDGVLRIEKSGRRTRKLDEIKAEEIIESNDLGDSVYKMVRVIDEDALMAAHYEGKLTEEEIDEMFPVSVVWALRTVKK
jgi:hypothetical protein